MNAKNTMEKKVIEVPAEICNMIEALHFEVTAREGVISTMLANDMDTTTEAFKNYQRELVQFRTQYDTAKNELQQKFVLPMIGDAKVRWNLDFASRQLTIEGA